MSDYLTRDGLIASVGEATVEALAGDLTDSDVQARVDQAIADAEAEMNGYLGGVHATPISPAPPMLHIQAVRISLWNLLSAKGYREDSPDKAIKVNYDKAVSWLEGVASGRFQLGTADDDGSTEPEPGASAVHPESALPDDWQSTY